MNSKKTLSESACNTRKDHQKSGVNGEGAFMEEMHKIMNYQGIVFRVDKSGISLISPVPVKPVSAAGPSMNEGIAMHAKVKPRPFSLTTSWKRFRGTT